MRTCSSRPSGRGATRRFLFELKAACKFHRMRSLLFYNQRNSCNLQSDLCLISRREKLKFIATLGSILALAWKPPGCVCNFITTWRRAFISGLLRQKNIAAPSSWALKTGWRPGFRNFQKPGAFGSWKLLNMMLIPARELFTGRHEPLLIRRIRFHNPPNLWLIK